MDKFIIVYESKINSAKIVTYHADLYENKNKGTMNVYAEELTTHRQEARFFYDIDEACKIANLFKTKTHRPSIAKML